MSTNNQSEPYPATGPGDTGVTAVSTAPATSTVPNGPEPGGQETGAQGDTSGGTAGTAREQAGKVAGSAREQAASVAGTAADSAKDVAGTAKESAGEVASTAKRQVKDLYEETRSQLTEQAGSQQKKVASGLHGLSDELRGMSEASSGSGIAADLVSQAASRTSSVASWLEDREPGSLLTEVRDFARRRPGTFIAVAAIAGVVAGRLTRSLVSEAKESSEDDTASPTGTSAGPATPTTDAMPPAAPTATEGFVPPVPIADAGADVSAPSATGAYRS